MPLITIAEALAPKIRLAIFQTEELTVAGTSPELEADLEALTTQLAGAYSQPADAATLFSPARELYRAIGLDPTKRRPSSEALVRRVIRGVGLYRINRVVDACNLCSMDFALPIGLYDTSTVAWPVDLRLGRPGEGYKGLGKEYVNVGGRWTLADASGPFGNPSADSFRTRIRETTRACTFVIFAPASYELARLRDHLHTAGQRMQRYADARIVHEELLA